MYISEFFRLYVLTENSFHQTILIEAKVVKATDNITKSQVELIPDVQHLVAPICLIILWAITVFLFLSNVRKFLQSSKVTIKRVKQVPCWNCRYFKDFKDNHYLNCAVHPSIVLTKHALNCSDYSSNSSITEPATGEQGGSSLPGAK
ncbi:MAG: hypothetical protein KME30_13825 [Iphinoe sp. HA4291-MV1]|jgi:hypothetical protein|nr:hypothetical protein [Iphinoe sp. HA4291-MV1]